MDALASISAVRLVPSKRDAFAHIWNQSGGSAEECKRSPLISLKILFKERKSCTFNDNVKGGRKLKNCALKRRKQPAPNWVIGAACIQYASAFVVMKMNMFP